MPEFFSFKRRYKDFFLQTEERFTSIIPVLAFDEDSHIFYLDDKTIGVGFECTPVSGSDDPLQQQTKAFLDDSYPDGSHLQFLWWRNPDINQPMADMRMVRAHYHDPDFAGETNAREKFFKSYTTKPLKIDQGGKVYNMGTVFDVKLYVTLKIPIADVEPTESEIKSLKNIYTKMLTSLGNMRMSPQPLTAQRWIRAMSTIFNWQEDAPWREELQEWDKTRILSDQILDLENAVDNYEDHLEVGNSERRKYIKVLAPKKRPQRTRFGEQQFFAGAMDGSLGGVRTNYLICANIYYPPADKKREKMEKLRTYAVNQATGPMAKFAPILEEKRVDFDRMMKSMEDGNRAIEMSFSTIVFANSKDEVDEAAQAAKNFWRTNRYEMLVNQFMQMPVLLNSLPLCQDATAIKELGSYNTATTAHATMFLPINSEWRGTGTPDLTLLSRNGQVMSFSSWDTDTNYSMCITAASGAGKSFLSNAIIGSILSVGGQVWTVDVGGSYQKLCETYKGDYIEFGPTSTICLNPFSNVASLCGTEKTRRPDFTGDPAKDEGAEDQLLQLLIAMVAPTTVLEDLERATLRSVLNKEWMKYYGDLQLDHIMHALLEHDDIRIKDLGHRLEPFSSLGSYGKWFIGKNNCDFKNRFTVLELEALNTKPDLQSVVLLMIIANIGEQVFLGDPARRKLFLIDEAWNILANGPDEVTDLIEAGYRRFRKNNGAMCLISQSLLDLRASRAGQAILDNSATTLTLRQKTETIEAVAAGGFMSLSDYELSQLKTVHTTPGVYSEMLIRNDRGSGIARLFVDPYTYLVYSSTPKDKAEIKVYTDQGLSTADAINRVLQDRGVEL
ncbi:type IV secretion system protein TraC [uncultured Umboniibacter sp.]|uniref:type IV secretion system protein TraC n=1 Tax=uncultured Umboniibacter sp. TaxID=1798917 RepID=UPI002636467B|nr:type IV secretion system protein TraC [uncultured Umboniibacter sp.]